MSAIKKFIRNELYGWKSWEVSWLILAMALIIGLSLYLKDTWMGILSATTGVACVICTGKGKLSAYVFGLVNSILYAIIAYQATYYGETMLNALYYVPMQFVGFWVWSNNMDAETQEVKKQHMTNRQRVLWLAILIAATIGYGFALKQLGDTLPFVDSFTTVSSVVAMIVSIKMYAEQWWIWVAVNIVTILMWAKDFAAGNNNIATLLMWVVYLINSVIMLAKWEKESHRQEV